MKRTPIFNLQTRSLGPGIHGVIIGFRVQMGCGGGHVGSTDNTRTIPG